MGDLKPFFLSGFLSSNCKVSPPNANPTSWYSIGYPTETSFATLSMKAGFTKSGVEKDYPTKKPLGLIHFAC